MTSIPTNTQTAKSCAFIQHANFVRQLGDGNKLRDMTSIRWLFRLRQPAHLVILLFVAYFTSLLLKTPLRTSPTSAITNILYLGSFSFHFGAQIWMTFISGIVLFFTIPRHVFGLVQEQLFPKYFLLNSFLAFITLTTFVQKHPDSINDKQTQVLVLGANFFLELITWLYVVPPILSIMQGRTQLEEKSGIKTDFGRHQKNEIRQCPFHGRLRKSFRKLHSLAAVANISAIVCNGIHLYHLANKLCDL